MKKLIIKKVFLILLMLLTLCSSCFALTSDEAVVSFKNFTNNIVTRIQESQSKNEWEIKYNQEAQKYSKIGHTNFRYSVDLKATNSLMYPFVGYLFCKSDTIRYVTSDNPYGIFSSEAAARNANKTVIDSTSLGNEWIRYQYYYENNNWVLKETAIYFEKNFVAIKLLSPYHLHSCINENI